MTESAVLFAYHLFVGFTVSLAVSLFAARKVATQATLVQDYTGRAMTTFKVDRREFLKTWGLYTAAGTFVVFIARLLWETHQYLQSTGVIG